MWAGISWWFLFARPWWLVTLSIFSRASHLCIFSGEMCVQILCPFLNRVFLLLLFTSFPFASLQDCAPGYHRGKLLEGDGRRARPLLAPCVPCNCNNHSDTCDPETGKCLVRWFVWVLAWHSKLQWALGVCFSGWRSHQFLDLEYLNLAKCKVYKYFLQKGLAKWPDIFGGNSFINSLNLFMGSNLEMS